MTAGAVRPPLRDWLVLRDRRPLAAPDFAAPLGRVQGRTKAEAEREAQAISEYVLHFALRLSQSPTAPVPDEERTAFWDMRDAIHDAISVEYDRGYRKAVDGLTRRAASPRTPRRHRPMSADPRAPRAPLTSDELREIRERATVAWRVLVRVCDGDRLRMSIPVREDDDDRVLAATINAVPALCAEVERLTRERDEAVKSRDAWATKWSDANGSLEWETRRAETFKGERDEARRETTIVRDLMNAAVARSVAAERRASALEAEVAGLRADAERLDALERWADAYVEEGDAAREVVTLEKYDDDETPDRDWCVTAGPLPDGFGTALGRGATLRTAIDAGLANDAARNARAALTSTGSPTDDER